jgi:hypothetical protein
MAIRAVRGEQEGHRRKLPKAIELAPDFADRLRGAKQEARFAGAAVPNYFRKPYGPGWALVGDAGYNKDFITAWNHGCLSRCRTLRDRARQSFSGIRPFEDAMEEYHRTRDARVKAMYEFTCQLATLEPLPPETQQLLARLLATARLWMSLRG